MFRWYNNGFTTLQNGNWNTWNHISIVWAGSNSQVTINGNTYSVPTNNVGSDRIRLEANNIYPTKEFFDLVRVRQYTSPEPTVTIGAEEIDTFPITFTESGLPSGTSWNVTFNSVTQSSTTATITFTGITSGSYSWNASTPISGGTGTQYVCSTSSGTMNVPAQTSQNIAYNTQYYLTVFSAYDSPLPSSGWFDSGSSITGSVASPVSGGSGTRYVCTGWSGTGSVPASGSASAVTFTISAPSNITWNWKTQYYLTVSSAYGTVGGAGWYDSGASAYASVNSLVVAGATGTQYVFTGWSGDASGTTSPSNAIIMAGPKTVTAGWNTEYELIVNSVHGSPTGAGWYGSSVTANFGVTSPDGTSGTRYVFTAWSGDSSSTSASASVLMDGPKTVTANWKTQYYLTFAQAGVGSDFSVTVMTVNGTGYGRAGYAAWANPGDVYTFSYASPLVVAANSEQYLLTGVSGNSSALSFTVSQPTTITGAYKTQYYLTTTSAYDSPSPANGWYDSGSSLSAFVASPVSGNSGTQYVCTGWSGTGSVTDSGSTSAMTFTISAPSNITWNWKTQYSVSFAVSPSGDGTTSPSGTNTWQDAGSISISGAPSYNYKFSSWSTDTGSITFGNSNAGSTTATINGPGTITANFAALPTATPTPTPVRTPTPTNSPTPSPSPTLSPSHSPTTEPSSSPTQSPSAVNNTATYAVYGVIVALIIGGVIAAVITVRAISKRNKTSTFQ